MKDTWALAFEKLMEHEGGFTDDPRDPGNQLPDGRPGCTNLGVTQAEWEKYVGHQVTQDDMRRLTKEDVNPFYKKLYWDIIKADSLPAGVDYMVFDMCVNSGPGKAAMTLQSCVGAKPDGAIGPATLAAISNVNVDELIDAFSEKRLGYMKSLHNWETYKGGWERRVKEVEALADHIALKA